MTDLATREIFGNLGETSQALFYFLALCSMGVFAWGIWRRVRLWLKGRPSEAKIDWRRTARNIVTRALTQRNLRRARPKASRAHRMLFAGFLALFIGTILVGFEEYGSALFGREPGDPLFHKGLYFLLYEVTLDAFGLLLIGGVLWFGYRRWKAESSMEHHTADWLVLGSLLILGVTGYWVEGLRIIREATPLAGFSFVGFACAKLMSSIGVTGTNVDSLHFGLWWFHSLVAFLFIGTLPYCRLNHALAGMASLAVEPRPLGQMEVVSMETVEETGEIGVGRLEQFSRLDLLRLDACVSCGRCEDRCPAHEAGKPLSPRDLVQALKGEMEIATAETKTLPGETVSDETLWACTTCNACNDVCPLGVRPVDYITDMRRHLIGEGRLRGTPAMSLQKMQRSGNPWGLPAQERLKWAEGLNVPTVKENPDFDVLYWVGCAASYDRRTMKVARALAQLFQRAEVNFAVLGPEERCTGESARRMGDEFVFQELAVANVQTFDRYQVKKIVTHCPHCLNSLRKDYPAFDGRYDVTHHTEFLRDLVDSGKLNALPTGSPDDVMTYHDPCYLARVNGIVNEPRELLPATTKELPRRGCDTGCCGGGGGRMWFDDSVDQRMGNDRIKEVQNSGANKLAVSCPFCLTMMSDGIAATQADIKVKDIAEILWEENEAVHDATRKH